MAAPEYSERQRLGTTIVTSHARRGQLPVDLLVDAHHRGVADHQQASRAHGASHRRLDHCHVHRSTVYTSFTSGWRRCPMLVPVLGATMVNSDFGW